jgi:hypothetical protein
VAALALATSPLGQKLRVGLFAESRLQPRWLVEAFAKVAAADFAEIVLIRVLDRLPRRLPWPWRVNKRDALVDLLRYVPHGQSESEDLDVAFALGEIDDSALDGIARLGVWRLSADGVREVVQDAPLTAASLTVRLAAGAEPRLACESWSRTERLFIARNRDQVLAKAAELPARALREAQRYGRGWLEQCKAVPQKQGESTISALQALGAMLRNRGLAISSALVHVEESYAAYRRGFGAIGAGLEGFTRLGAGWRTPFPKGRCVFFEQAGRIGVSEVRADGGFSPPAMLFEGRYPFLIDDHDQHYLAAAARGGIALYRSIDFPLRWKLERVLLEGEGLVDPTLHRAPERWWLFAASKSEDELNLYHAPQLSGPWQPHERNPVKSDARGARPAGRLYWRYGVLYRPARIPLPCDGAGVALNRVLRLTPHDYAERQVQTIPGIRCLNQGAELTVVDAFTRRRRFA